MKSLILLTPFCLMGVFVLIAAVLILRRVASGGRTASPQQLGGVQAQQSAQLAGEAAGLVPWAGPASFGQLAAASQCTWKRFGAFTAQGTCPSLADSRRGMFAFKLHQTGQSGVLAARTTSHEIQITLNGGWGAITINGHALGSAPLGAGQLLDPAGQVVGDCSRDPGSQIHFGRVEAGAVHRPYALRIHGRQIATLTTVGGRTGIGLIDGTAPPLVPHLAAGLTPSDEAWLLAVCVLEVGYHAPRRLLHRGRG